jgi:hypothetical protein
MRFLFSASHASKVCSDGFSARALGEEVRYNEVSPEVYRSLGFPGADDLGNMFQFNRDFSDSFRGARNHEVARAPGTPGPSSARSACP